MEILRSGKDGRLEVVDISSAALREEILLVLADYGVIYSDTRPADLRADLAYLRGCRERAQHRGEVVHQLLLRAGVTALLTVLAAGFWQWLKGAGGAAD
jgi:uncharacterized membrane protein